MKKHFFILVMLSNQGIFGRIIDIFTWPREEKILQFIDENLINESVFNQTAPFKFQKLKEFDELLYALSKDRVTWTNEEAWQGFKGYYQWLLLAKFLTNEEYVLQTPSPFKDLDQWSISRLKFLTDTDILNLSLLNLKNLIKNDQLISLNNGKFLAIKNNGNFKRFSSEEKNKIEQILSTKKPSQETGKMIVAESFSPPEPSSKMEQIYNSHDLELATGLEVYKTLQTALAYKS